MYSAEGESLTSDQGRRCARLDPNTLHVGAGGLLKRLF